MKSYESKVKKLQDVAMSGPKKMVILYTEDDGSLVPGQPDPPKDAIVVKYHKAFLGV